MFCTRATEILGIKYPIVQGAMLRASLAELVAAVSNVGGLGMMASAIFSHPDDLRREIRKAKSLMERRRVGDEGFRIVKPFQQGRTCRVLIPPGKGRYLQKKLRLTPCQQPR